MGKHLSEEQREIVAEIRECETLRELDGVLSVVDPFVKSTLAGIIREQVNAIEAKKYEL